MSLLILKKRCIVKASGYFSHRRMNPISSTHCGKLILKFKKEKVLPDNFLSSFLGHHLYCCLCDIYVRRAPVK